MQLSGRLAGTIGELEDSRVHDGHESTGQCRRRQCGEYFKQQRLEPATLVHGLSGHNGRRATDEIVELFGKVERVRGEQRGGPKQVRLNQYAISENSDGEQY